MNKKERASSTVINSYVGQYKSMPTAALARKIYRENKKHFPSLNAVMCAIRYRRGSMGIENRSKRGVSSIQATPPSKYNSVNPLRLPESDKKEWARFEMDGCKRVGVMGDLHLPYHDMDALTCAILDLKKNKVDGILLNGDLVDFHQISRFVHDPAKRNFKEEKLTVIKFLERLRQLFPKARIVYKEGNHSERLWNYLAPRISDIYMDEDVRDALSLRKLFKMDNFGVEWVGEKREIMLGKLPVLHGHEFRSGFAPPVNPARGAFLKAKESIMVNHHHKTSEHTETTLGRKIITAWSVGCLCELRPSYDPYNGYNHGFAIVDIEKDGGFHVQNKRILNGVIL